MHMFIYIYIYRGISMYMPMYIFEEHAISFLTFFIWALLLIVYT